MTGGVRPGRETFTRDRWQLTIVDGPAIFEEAGRRPVELLHGNPFPPPVRRTRLTVSQRDGVVHLAATIHSGVRAEGPYLTVLGRGPLGTLLRRRVEADDERAVRIVAGLQAAVDRVNRWGPRRRSGPDVLGRPLASRIAVDEATGLRTTVTEHAPSGHAPSGPSPSGDAPAGKAPSGNAPSGNAPSGNVPAGKAPSGKAPGGDASSGKVDASGRRVLTLQASVAADLAAPVHLSAFFDVLARAATVLIGRPVEGTFTLAAERPGVGPWRPTLDQVGGLDEIVAQFRDVADSFRHPAVMSRWGARRPQGILLYGPPGTGKTMLARALAEEIDATVREIRTPEILDKWLGASERNMKRIFREARQYTAPTVMLFDEFDSIISYAGAGTDSGSHAVNAVAGIFKQEMNNLIDANPFVIVVATTNFPALIDSSLIRSGRFDLKLEVPLPDAAGRAQILARMIRALIAEHEGDGFRLFGDTLNLERLAAASAGMTGADLREVLRRAQMVKAMHEVRTGAAPNPIEQADLLAEIKRLRDR